MVTENYFFLGFRNWYYFVPLFLLRYQLDFCVVSNRLIFLTFRNFRLYHLELRFIVKTFLAESKLTWMIVLKCRVKKTLVTLLDMKLIQNAAL